MRLTKLQGNLILPTIRYIETYRLLISLAQIYYLAFYLLYDAAVIL